jgi:hypothetical protein
VDLETGCVEGENFEGKQILEELGTISFDRSTFYDLVVKMQTLKKKDPGNFLVNKYLDSLTDYAESTIDPDEDKIAPPSYCSEDPHHADTLEQSGDEMVPDNHDHHEKDRRPTSPPVITTRSMSSPMCLASRPAAERQLSEDLEGEACSPISSSSARFSITRSSTSPPVFSPGLPGSQTSSSSQLTTGSAFPDLSWVEKQADATFARKSADSKTLRKLNGQLRCITNTTPPTIIEGLLLKGADPNSVNRKYKSNVVDIGGIQSKDGSYSVDRCALINAICARNIECVKLLLAYGADPNINDGGEQSCLFFAVAYGEDEIVDALLRTKANANKVQDLDRWAGTSAWPSGSPFLDPSQVEADQVEISCHSLLITAISMAAVDWHPKRSTIISLLLANAADVTDKAHKNCHSGKDHAHTTPLGLAAASIACGGDAKPEGECPAVQICRLLIDAGASTDSLAMYKETQSLATPLDLAIMREPPAKELVELLQSRGASLSLGVDGFKVSKQHISRLASGANLLLVADERQGLIEWLVTLIGAHRVLGVTMLLQLVAEFSFTEESKARKDHTRPRHYSREELEAAIEQLRRCGITSREEGQVQYVRRKRFYEKNAANWSEGQIVVVTLIRDMQLDETKISREELVKMVEGPLLV